MRRVMFVTLICTLCCSVRAQQPSSIDASLRYLHGPAFPSLKHGPAWPKNYQSDTPAPVLSAEPVTGTVQTETSASKIHAPRRHSKRCKGHHRHTYRHCRVHYGGGADLAVAKTQVAYDAGDAMAHSPVRSSDRI